MDFKPYEKMINSEVEHVYTWIHNEFIKLRTGRASPAILDGLVVDYYGEKTPINQLANISLPEPRVLLIKPYDRSSIKDVAAAINESNLGINPQVDADVIRLTFQAPTEDIRKGLVKKAKAIAEDAKIKVRRIRQDAQDKFKKEVGLVEDDKKYFQTELDNLTKEINKHIESLLANKEKDILTI
ncbi:ribosome recycling factor [Ureaplasma diversum]|nr:ribosome recycling factor [Ureaplasma diversum]